MKQASNLVHQNTDVSKFAALHANLKKASHDTQRDTAATTALRKEIARIADYAKTHPSDEFVAANKDLLSNAAGGETWTGAGNISMSSFIWWAVGGGIAFPGLAPLAFLFGGKGGPDWALSTFTSVVGGSFVVDPRKIVMSDEFHLEDSPIGWVRKGPCNFTLSEGGVGLGEVNMSFYSTSGAFWGTVNGVAPGLGGVSVNGTLDMVWQGF